jgi:hypothetical protein
MQNDVSIADQIAEVRRELGMRRYKYPQWTGAGTMKQADADRQMKRLEAVLETLMRVQERERPPLPL